MLKHKRYHYMLTQMLSQMFFQILLEFSYTPFFTENLYTFLLVLQLLESGFTYTMQNHVLKENLLIQPLTAALETIQFVMFMAAYNFQLFVVSYLVRLCIIMFFRTYIDPILKNLEYNMRKFARFLVQKNPKLIPYLKNYLRSELEVENIQFYLGFNQNAQKMFEDSTSLENVLNQLLSYSSKIHSIILKPLLLILIKIYAKETMIPTLYQIKYNNFDFYLYFAVLIVIPQIFIDIFVMNSLELVHGFKLFDYFCYCKYRFENRATPLMSENMDLER